VVLEGLVAGGPLRGVVDAVDVGEACRVRKEREEARPGAHAAAERVLAGRVAEADDREEPVRASTASKVPRSVPPWQTTPAIWSCHVGSTVAGSVVGSR